MMSATLSILDLAFIPAGGTAREAFAGSVALAQKAEALGDETRVATVEATPGKGTRVPLYILGSSLFGAQLAAQLGLPYAFASHFAPDALEEAVDVYRRDFRPSAQLDAPYVIAGLNVLAADTRAEAEAQLAVVQRARVRALLGRGQRWTDEEADAVLESPAGRHVKGMT